MIKLINGLLNVSRIDMGTLSIIPEPVDLKKEADTLINELQFGIKAKNLKIIKKYDPTLPKIDLDLNLIRIALQNLLSNAVKYSRENGQVIVEIKKQNAKEAYVAVSDDGYGIPKQQQPSIFKKLFRADNVKTLKVEGTGLGLYVAKAVVEAFGGKIDFKSEENKGTVFFFTLPLKGAKKKEGTKGLEANV
jgi:signal transduction histidine kinase